MEYLVSDLVAAIKVAIDENVSSVALSSEGDVDTLTLDEIVLSKVPIAARLVESVCPVWMLDGGKPFGASVAWDSAEGHGSGRIVLPGDFLRLVSFQMSDWERGVSSVITEADASYAQQRSRYGGGKGNPQRPVVAIVSRPSGLVLEFYSCSAGEGVYVKHARYIAMPVVVNGTIDICEKVKDAVVHYAAYLVLLAVGDANGAAGQLAVSKELMA